MLKLPFEFLIFAVMLAPYFAIGQEPNSDFDDAMKLARQNKKPILVYAYDGY